MIGTRWRPSRRRRAIAKPSRSGSITSRTTRSGRKLSISCSATRPVAASRVSNPSYRKAAAVTVAAAASQAAATRQTGLTANQIYDADGSGVVEITVTTQGSSDANPFGPSSGSSQAQGSGFVLDTQGHIVTNEHVVSGANSVSVKFADGTTRTATVVGTDPSTDLAVIKVDAPASSLHPLTLGDSGAVKVGDAVVAIGSPEGL